MKDMVFRSGNKDVKPDERSIKNEIQPYSSKGFVFESLELKNIGNNQERVRDVDRVQVESDFWQKWFESGITANCIVMYCFTTVTQILLSCESKTSISRKSHGSVIIKALF